MRSLAEALRATLERMGIRRDVARAAALQRWPQVAHSVLGGEPTRTRALRVDGEVLVVAVASPVVAQELRLRSAELLRALLAAAPECGVRALRFVPGTFKDGAPRRIRVG